MSVSFVIENLLCEFALEMCKELSELQSSIVNRWRLKGSHFIETKILENSAWNFHETVAFK